jgi:hypothetical protein
MPAPPTNYVEDYHSPAFDGRSRIQGTEGSYRRWGDRGSASNVARIHSINHLIAIVINLLASYSDYGPVVRLWNQSKVAVSAGAWLGVVL